MFTIKNEDLKNRGIFFRKFQEISKIQQVICKVHRKYHNKNLGGSVYHGWNVVPGFTACV